MNDNLVMKDSAVEPLLEHAQGISQTMYDGTANAGYVRFCECKVNRTDDLLKNTKHQLLCDWDESGTHIVGLEILHFPVEGFRLNPLSVDLAYTKLSDAQKQAVLARFIKN